ncbi:glycosyltransferase family 2 protein [Desulfotignum phosphitoxidans]|uniref:Glycosyl transferase, family 2 n=1 Tax=Desulfotignum phosphitoxidans DSM 13687 TaxID=1286635 RepID=S0FSH1_9BACT|nr:glycosyltransferase family 2 protein [Desulfotignum phosphitoxidans]EMS77640.1 glycosyl transferase, family 2 [Desulfotignum phosphitoxidans DSM 13687]
MKLSIVSTLYQSAPYIEEFCSRAATAAREVAGEDYEIILVNDGSPDNSLEIAVSSTHSDPHIVVVDLSRNFGHHKAMMTGLSHSQGDFVFLIDSDLEEEPEWLLSFFTKMEKEKCDVIFGVQENRKGNLCERWSGSLFYLLFNRLTGLNLSKNIVTTRLMSQRYVQALIQHQERELMIAGLWHLTGFKQVSEIVKKHNSSKTSYTFHRKISLLVNSITAFSNVPLKGIFYTGFIISLFALIYVLYLIFNKIFLATPLSGWTSVMASVWLLGGLIISFVGIVGMYISKVFIETKQRPYTIIRDIYGKK